MSDKEEALEERRELKRKKPDFDRHDSHKNKNFGSSWRRPKGLQSKLRLEKRGYGRKVKTGWGSPKEVRGLHPSGLEPVRVHNASALSDIDADIQGIVIASSVGDRKRVNIIEEAQEKDIKILNLEANEYLEKVEERMEEQKEKREQRKKKQEEMEKEVAEKEEGDERIDPEDKKEQEQKEMEKVVTKK